MEDKGGLDYYQFSYMVINLVKGYDEDIHCKNCLKLTRENIKSFFEGFGQLVTKWGQEQLISVKRLYPVQSVLYGILVVERIEEPSF